MSRFRNEKLYVVTSVFNPLRYKSRIKLFHEFEKRMHHERGVELYVSEIAFGQRDFEVTKRDDSHHLRLRTKDELFLKENALNLTVARLPSNWKYVAFIDADIHFLNPHWVEETKHQLQHTPVCQMFSTAYDLTPDHNVYQTFKSLAYAYVNGLPIDAHKYGKHSHPGFAHAFTRDAFDGLGGLIDWGILGSGDRHMMMSLIGRGLESAPPKVDAGYKEWIQIWQARADRYVQGHLGYVDGGIHHYYHGQKSNRQYADRWKILVRNRFDPELDLKRGWNGLYQLTDRNPKLKRELYQYFKMRNEDSVDIVDF